MKPCFSTLTLGISGVLVNAAGRPIQFCSRKLTDAESHYDMVEREALAVYGRSTDAERFF